MIFGDSIVHAVEMNDIVVCIKGTVSTSPDLTKMNL